MADLDKAMTHLEQAKARFCLRSVFFPMLVMGTPIDPDETIDTMCTDGTSIWFSPEYILQQQIDVVIALLAHEILHIILKHCTRRGSRDAEVWNYACDFVVNGVLVENGFTLWQGALHDLKYKGMSAEVVYDLIMKDARNRPPKGDTAGKDLREPQGKTQEQIEQAEQNITERVASAVTQARAAGKLPECLDQLVGKLLNPVIPWEQVLLEYMQNVSSEGVTWSRRNRRFPNTYLPGRFSQCMGEIVIIGDTSGSAHYLKNYYERIGGELSYIMDMVKPERVRVVWADDTECSREEVFEEGEPLELHPKGGGGTDMRKPLAFVERYEPILVILITDCETPWPAETDYPLLVLSVNDQSGPSWATTINVKL